ncbi:glutaredoxin [Pseudovirgaria hyperparasitica]|uniref:Glutaredoxin n=1 Tax=Pseudovirgaria hyperparasitica TaxID=470096 RepID=A0A6A6VUU7_9PEZI|nr:glutaredoxin [Pseudovirgaria hyperparasitica]KAF2754458.1 glutaredoxin [Pseudovirgaria hyperparasitica]
MPSQRRVKVFGLLIVLAILTTIYWASAAQQTKSSKFYTNTVAALEEKKQAEIAAKVKAENDATAARKEDIGIRLKAAEEKAKKSADEKGHRISQQVMASNEEKKDAVDEKSVAGRVKYKDEKEKDTPGVARVGGNTENMEKLDKESKSEEDQEVEMELNSILKRSPIIIFSKSYCPYSKTAKHILLDLYKITPPPHVVELDQHELGPGLQDALAKMTNRKTVPNILINGLSIGGGDDIKTLHQDGKIIDTITTTGGKRIIEVKQVEEPASKDGLRKRHSGT